MRALRRIYPPIRVHAWGGFGSQLFALVALLKLEKRFPQRKLKLIFHTSGVTYRSIEFQEERIPHQLKIVDDFQVQDYINARAKGLKTHKRVGKQSVKELLKKLGIFVGVISNMNEEAEFNRIVERVIDIRGHYSKLEISMEFALYLLMTISTEVPNLKIESSKGTIHWRMGDLLELHNKAPIPAHRIGRIMQSNKEIKDWLIFSDSGPIDLALQESLISNNYSWSEPCSIEETMKSNLSSSIFVGTNSKISFWIAVFRSLVNPDGITYLPIELKNSFNFPAFVSPKFY